MALTATDWTIDRATGNIRYIGDDHGGASPSYATVIEFHRWLNDLADDGSSTGDDQLAIVDAAPSSRSTDNIITLINGYNIDATAAEHLYDGSIIQAGGATIYDGIVNIGTASNIQIIQNGAVLADDWWNSNGGLNADSANGISHKFMLLVRDGGADIDGRRLVATTREFNSTYEEFKINGTSRGNNVLALSAAADLNNATAAATVATWTGITNLTEGYVGIDASGDAVNEYYYSQWDKDVYSINQLYERLKWLTRQGSTSTLYGLNGELFRGITHEITVDTPTGTFAAYEAVSWSGGTGQMLAINSPTAPTKMWIQLLTGVAPTDGQVITGASTATATVNVTVTERVIPAPFVGQSTGSAIIGAYGIGIQAADLSASDKVFDLNNTQITPPNNVTFAVGGLVTGEDRVLVGPENGAGGLAVDQLTLNTSLTGAAVTSVVVTTPIPSDTPSSGTIRIQNDAGSYVQATFTSYTGSTFTINSQDFSGANAATAPKNVFVSYIDKLATAVTESFTTVYSSDRTLFIRVRDGGVTPIVPFETTGTLSSGGGSVTAIRQADV